MSQYVPIYPNTFLFEARLIELFCTFQDDTLKPWLIEVNSSPSLACDWQVDVDVKHTMMQDTMKLVRTCWWYSSLPDNRIKVLH